MKLHSLLQKYVYPQDRKVNNMVLCYNHRVLVMELNHPEEGIEDLKKSWIHRYSREFCH